MATCRGIAELNAGDRGTETAWEAGTASLTGDRDPHAISRDSFPAEMKARELWSSKRQDLLLLGFAY